MRFLRVLQLVCADSRFTASIAKEISRGRDTPMFWADVRRGRPVDPCEEFMSFRRVRRPVRPPLSTGSVSLFGRFSRRDGRVSNETAEKRYQ